jgi:hypothetical protein
MKSNEAIIECRRCGSECPKNGPNQRYCLKCQSEKLIEYRAARYQKRKESGQLKQKSILVAAEDHAQLSDIVFRILEIRRRLRAIKARVRGWFKC